MHKYFLVMDNIKLLAIDLINRQQYGVKINVKGEYDDILNKIEYKDNKWVINENLSIYDIKPYLIPLNSMTTSQQEELSNIVSNDDNITEFCYKHHIDCANLIEKNIAIQMNL